MVVSQKVKTETVVYERGIVGLSKLEPAELLLSGEIRRFGVRFHERCFRPETISVAITGVMKDDVWQRIDYIWPVVPKTETKSREIVSCDLSLMSKLAEMGVVKFKLRLQSEWKPWTSTQEVVIRNAVSLWQNEYYACSVELFRRAFLEMYPERKDELEGLLAQSVGGTKQACHAMI